MSSQQRQYKPIGQEKPIILPGKRSQQGKGSRVGNRLLLIVCLLYLILSFRLWYKDMFSKSSSNNNNNTSVFNKGEGIRQEVEEVNLIEHLPARSNTQLFVTMGSYIIDGDAESGTRPMRNTQDLILIVIGVGDFTSQPQPSSDASRSIPPQIPKGIKCIVSNKGGRSFELENARFHSNGTAYQGKISPSRGALYFGERAVWISCPITKSMEFYEEIQKTPKDFNVRITTPLPFDSNPTVPSLLLSSAYKKKAKFNLTLCSSAIYGLGGSKWIIEWLEYHRAAGFDSMDLYVHQVGDLVTKVLKEYQKRNSNEFFVRIHDWTKLIDNGRIGFNEGTGVGLGVASEAWEHGQRLTRNDCFLRNRGRSKWIMFSDVDELFTSKLPGKTVWNGPILDYCEKQYQMDSTKIACSFSSVTVPPNAKKISEEEEKTRLLLERIDTSEAHCQSPYNCGRFHYGREKYAIRTEYGSLNPNGPFFYHAISQNYDISNEHHSLLPNSIGVVRHYAGHFSHSRKGGLPRDNTLYNPLQEYIIKQMKNRIFDSLDGSTIRYLYQTPNQHEKFLKLYDISNYWRFAKIGEGGENQQQRSVEEEEKEEVNNNNSDEDDENRYLTFEYFGGRLNNQLWTFDWVFRVALALNRTVLINEPTSKEHYIGFPSSETDNSLWDMDVLKTAPFRFKFAWEVKHLKYLFENKENLPKECVWEFSPENKWIMKWATSNEVIARCLKEKRLHVSTGGGLVHSYKADTRKYGVDPLVYWKHMRLHPQIHEYIETWWRSVSNKEMNQAIGLHFRSWREANGDEAHARKVCNRLSEKLLDNAARRVNALKTKCPESCHEKFPDLFDVYSFWKENSLQLTCEPASQEHVRKLCGDLLPEEDDEENFFVATDHETEEADLVFQSLHARMISKIDTKAFISKFQEYNSVKLPVAKYANSILPILLDLGGLLKVGRFFGSPASTLSQAVCLWRKAYNLKEEDPGMCQLVWYSTYSDQCEEICF